MPSKSLYISDGSFPHMTTVSIPRFAAYSAASIFVLMPPVPLFVPAPPEISYISSVILSTLEISLAFLFSLGLLSKKTLNVGENNEEVGSAHGGHHGRKTVVIAENNFLDRHRIVFVYDRHGAHFKQTLKGCSLRFHGVFRPRYSLLSAAFEPHSSRIREKRRLYIAIRSH